MKNVAVIILAAGKGTRMKSSLPKVVHKLCSRPMLLYVIDLVKSLKIKPVVAVVGYKRKLVQRFLGPEIKIAIQKELRGSADAVKVGLRALGSFHGTVLILYGDIPLLQKETLVRLLKYRQESRACATLLVATVKKPAGYGRILRDKYGTICGIVEDKDADDFHKGIKEINTGIVCFDKDKLQSALSQVRANNQKREYYLTDIIGIFYKKNFLIESVTLEDPNEAIGINSQVELAWANAIMQRRLNENIMKKGVTLVDPDSTFIGYGARIGKDTTIYPFTVIESNVTIGKRCSVGPFAHLREGCVLADDVSLGNFLEVVRSRIASRTSIKHFGYIGDATVGRGVNIGAGCVTANFDGKAKHPTIIKKGAFLGSDTVLIAPVKVGARAKTGAGCVVVKNQDIPDGAVVVGVPARSIRIDEG